MPPPNTPEAARVRQPNGTAAAHGNGSAVAAVAGDGAGDVGDSDSDGPAGGAGAPETATAPDIAFHVSQLIDVVNAINTVISTTGMDGPLFGRLAVQDTPEGNEERAAIPAAAAANGDNSGSTGEAEQAPMNRLEDIDRLAIRAAAEEASRDGVQSVLELAAQGREQRRIAMESIPHLDMRSIEYVSEYDEQLECPVCQTPLLDPRMTRCLHTFCRDCFERMLENDDRCPLDRQRLESFVNGASVSLSCPAPPLIKGMLDNLRVRCPNRYCDFECVRSRIQYHYSIDCRFTRVKCPGPGCDKKVMRYRATNGRCLHTDVACDYCGKQVELATIEDHYEDDCDQNEIECQHCKQPVAKHNYGKHVADCPDRLVDCEFRACGCPEVLRKGDAAAHQKACVYGLIFRMEQRHKRQMEDVNTSAIQSNMRIRQLEFHYEELTNRLRRRRSAATSSASGTESAAPGLSAGPSGPSADLSVAAPSAPPAGASSRPAPMTIAALEEFYRETQGAAPTPPAALMQAAHAPVQAAPPAESSLEVRVSQIVGDLDSVTARVQAMERGMGDADARLAMRFINELAPIREQLADLYASMGHMNQHVLRMTDSFRHSVGRHADSSNDETAVAASSARAASASASADASGPSSASSSQAGSVTLLEPRRLLGGGRRMSDRENPPRL